MGDGRDCKKKILVSTCFKDASGARDNKVEAVRCFQHLEMSSTCLRGYKNNLQTSQELDDIGLISIHSFYHVYHIARDYRAPAKDPAPSHPAYTSIHKLTYKHTYKQYSQAYT